MIRALIVGLVFMGMCGVLFYSRVDSGNANHWIPQTVVVGLIILLLLLYWGRCDDNDDEVKKSIQDTITTNYDNVYMYHDDKDGKYFISDTTLMIPLEQY